MFQSSFNKQPPNLTALNKNQLQISQSQTSQTLTHISQNSVKVQLKYYLNEDSQSSRFQVLKYTLSHGNLQQLQKNLNHINRSSEDIVKDQRTADAYKECTGNLESISDNVQATLNKINYTRKIIQLKLIKKFMLESKRTNTKNIKKSNLCKYRQLLLIIKQLYERTHKNTYMQSQITQLNKRLRTSGLLLVPSLIENALINMAYKCIFQRKCIIEIKNTRNLAIIIDNFMNDEKILSGFSQSNMSQSVFRSNIQQLLYTKFKMYTIIKRYISYRSDKCQFQSEQYQYCQNKKIDELCQKNISEYLVVGLRGVSNVELSKIRSIAQSDLQINRYLQKIVNRYLLQMFVQIEQYIKRLKNRQKYIEQNLINIIIKQNKKNIKNSMILVNRDCVQFLQVPHWRRQQYNIVKQKQDKYDKYDKYQYLAEEQEQQCEEDSGLSGIICIEQIGQLLQTIQQKSPILQLYQNQLKIKMTSAQLKLYILVESIRFLLLPIIRLQLKIFKNRYQNIKQERNYHFLRIFHVDVWRLFFGGAVVEGLGASQECVRSVREFLEDVGCCFGESEVGQEKYRKQNKDKKIKEKHNQKSITDKNRPKNRDNKNIKKILNNTDSNKILKPQPHNPKPSITKTHISICQFLLQYHKNYGQIYLFLVNKLTNLINTPHNYQTPTNNSYSLYDLYAKKRLSIDNFMWIWVQMINQQIVQHLLCEYEPVNVLQSIQFYSEELISGVQEAHRIQNILNALYTTVNASNSSTNITKNSKNKSSKPNKNKKDKTPTQITQLTQIDSFSQQNQQIYIKLMSINLKTRNYQKLTHICKQIGAYNEIYKMHEDLYKDISKDLIL